jgi:hypothetical protein
MPYAHTVSNLWSDSLTVCIPVFRSSKYLESTLKSIRTITKPKIYGLVVEDGPLFDSNFEISSASGISYFHSDGNVGISGNFNKCIGLVNSDFYLILGPDDCLVTIEECVLDVNFQTLHEGEVDKIIFFFPTEVIDENGKIKYSLRDIFKRLLFGLDKITGQRFQLHTSTLGYWLYSPSIIWPKNTLEKFIYSEEFAMASDFQRVSQYLMSGYKFLQLDTTSSIQYRRHSHSESSLSQNRIKVRSEEIAIYLQIRSYMISQKKYFGVLLTYLQVFSRGGSLLSILERLLKR